MLCRTAGRSTRLRGPPRYIERRPHPRSGGRTQRGTPLLSRGLLEASRKWYTEHADNAKSLVGKYNAKGTATDESAAWVATCRIMLNMDEFITRE